MNKQTLIQQIISKQTYLCVGLDTDIHKIPKHLFSEADPVFAFNKAIIDATRDLCVAYKINTAFYEALGAKGWEAMEKTVHYIGNDHFKIADAKRGDIGNTSEQYAKAFFETLPFDAVTVAPYMGEDSVRPFLHFEDKWAIVLGLTSNKGAADFELQKTGERYLYEAVLEKVSAWGTPENLMFVIGATRPEEFTNIRRLCPDHFFLVPGVGTQGGSLEEITEKAMNKNVGILVNVSRAIIYDFAGEDYAEKAKAVAASYQQKMKLLLKKNRNRQLMIVIREASSTDIKQIQILRNTVKENILSDPGLVSDKDCEEYINVRGKGWVCENNGEIVGFSIADLRENNIWALFVHPAFENQGIGRQLHDKMLDWFFSQAKHKAWLSTAPNTRAEIFYRKSGWVETGSYGKNEIKFEMTAENWRQHQELKKIKAAAKN